MALKKPTKLTIGNTTIEIGKKYMIDHKFDASAPNGLKSIKATKYPMADNDTLGCVYFDETTRQFDTGFYEHSKCLNRLTSDIAKERVAAYKKEILTPYEKYRNVELDQTANSNFWREYRYTIHANKEFDTNNISDLFDLYNALMQGDICNEDERDPMYRQHAMFTITNPTEIKDKSKNTTRKRLDCVRVFDEMTDSNREKINTILSFIGRGDSSKIDDDDLKLMYYTIINDPNTGLDFVDRFNEARDKYETETGKLELEYFTNIQKLLTTNKIKKVGSRYMTTNESTFLGNSVQDIAKFCLDKSSHQYEVINELIET
jgi:hypothetical protein